MNYSEYRYLILSDLYRIRGNTKFKSFLYLVFMGECFKYNFWLRTCRYTKTKLLLKYTVYPIGRFMLNHLHFKLGISLHPPTEIGSGLYIGHHGTINVHVKCIIGKNLNISQGVTIAGRNRGKYKGYPIIGDNVYIGPGAKVIGAVNIGNNVAIGANCVVTKDIPDNSVVVGVPGKVISNKGSIEYVNKTDYDDKISR